MYTQKLNFAPVFPLQALPASNENLNEKILKIFAFCLKRLFSVAIFNIIFNAIPQHNTGN